MDAEARPLDPLLQQWRAMPPGDRKAVLNRLDPDQRLTFQRILAETARENAQLASRAQKFSEYSPWFAELLEACEKDGPGATHLKSPVKAALLAGHDEEAGRANDLDAPHTLAALTQSLLKAVRSKL